MTSKRDEVERRRGEPSRDGVRRRLLPSIDDRRHLSATRPGTDRNSAGRVGPRDPRFDYLTHSHD